MSHARLRHAIERLQFLAKLWPVVGLLGARQTGKTTLFVKQMKISNSVSFDDADLKEEARASTKTFLGKRGTPLLIDEVQKVPEIFDAIKLQVDRKRIPGSYFLTGSTQFSQKLGVQESLTGRIGLLQLHPLTLAESLSLPAPHWKRLIHGSDLPRLSPDKLAQYSTHGGIPVPMFLRDSAQMQAYWSGWVETTLYRDLLKVFGKAYQPEMAEKILREFGNIMADGELPTLRHFSISARKLRAYLLAMESIFLIKKFPTHEKAIGSEAWLLMDSGLCCFLMKTDAGEGPSLSLIRHSVWNELSANHEYLLGPFRPTYYKSAKGTPVDWVDEDSKTAFKVIIHGRESSSSLTYQERSLAGAMKTLGIKRGFLVAPIEKPDIPKSEGIGILPWTYWS